MDKRRAAASDDKAPKASESPVAASNVMHYSEGQKVASRVGHRHGLFLLHALGLIIAIGT